MAGSAVSARQAGVAASESVTVSRAEASDIPPLIDGGYQLLLPFGRETPSVGAAGFATSTTRRATGPHVFDCGVLFFDIGGEAGIASHESVKRVVVGSCRRGNILHVPFHGRKDVGRVDGQVGRRSTILHCCVGFVCRCVGTSKGNATGSVGLCCKLCCLMGSK